MDRSWLHPDIEVRGAAVEGRGLFARADIEAGEVLLVLKGERIDAAAMRAVAASGQRYSAMQIDEDVHLLMDWDDPASRGNHSCDPNMWLDDACAVAARRRISVGDELTIDYATMSADEVWSMPCACGAASCRELLRGDDWRRTDIQQRYLGHFAPFLERRIKLLAGR